MILIRDMRTEDVKAVAELESQIFSKPWSRQGFLDAVKLENTIFLVAEEEDSIVGYMGMYISLDEGEITNVAVKPCMRCHGIGGKMIKVMQKKAKQRGICSIVLEVRVSNTNAIRLYEQNGFLNQGVRKEFYELPREDAYIMIYGQ